MDLYTDKEIGLLIKQARIFKNITQKELGERIGVQAAAVQKWESGQVKNIKRSVLQKLCVELGLSPVNLVGFKFVDSAILKFSKSELNQVNNIILDMIQSRKK